MKYRIRMYFATLAYRLWIFLDAQQILMPTHPLQSYRECRGLFGRVAFSPDEMDLAIEGHYYRYLVKQTSLQSNFISACRVFDKNKAAGAHIGVAAADKFLIELNH